MTDPIALAQKLIQCASVTPLDAGAIDVMVATLAPLGFRCHKLQFADQGLAPIENLYARFGTASPNLCFAGHTDVVPVGDAEAWRHDPFGGQIEDGILYGRGVSDMKGGVACFTAAAARFLQKNPDFRGSISFLITGDEEADAINGTVKVLKWMEEQGEKIDHCLVGEPSNLKVLGDTIKIGRRGSLNAKLTVHGKQGHSAYPQLADNPLTRLVRMLTALKEKPLDDGTPFFQSSSLEITSIDVGNKATNVIPSKGVAQFNVRFNDTYSEKTLLEWIHQKLEPLGAYELQTALSGESFVTEPGWFSSLVQDAIHKVTGVNAKLDTGGGTSDARFIQNYCPVLEFGLLNETIHKVDECASVEDLVKLTDIYERVLERYFTNQ